MTHHFIGLGGIGMSALARILLQRGKRVQGSDIRESALLEELRREGASVRIGHNGDLGTATTVVFSTDIKAENVDLSKAKEMKLPLMHRSDLLHALMQGTKPLLVTGTHGKTTTSALLASVLVDAGLDPSFVVGGIHQKWKTNGRAGTGEFFVAEADESDGSFLKTPAFGAIVTNLENDHLDFWGSEKNLDDAFGKFFAQAQTVFWCGDDARLKKLKPKGFSYGFGDCDWKVRFEPTEKGMRFDVNGYKDIELSLFGRHNALNGAAVFGLCIHLGVPETAIRKAFLEFAGTGRRLEFKGSAHAVEVYDDYGHHPTEIAATLKALRDKVREKRILAVFQPHRYTRVRDVSFLDCFKDADVVVMTDIYSAGEAPIEGISSATLYAQMRKKLGAKLQFFSRVHLEAGVVEMLRPHDVVLTLGAGDVTKAGEPILKSYKEKAPKWTVGLLFGGASSEHAVSLMSAETFIETIDRSLYDVKLFKLTKTGDWRDGPKLPIDVLQDLLKCDVVIPIFHGQQGEDGMIQGLMDTLQIPYAGCDYRSGALCMQKSWTKQIAMAAGVPTPRFIEMNRTEYSPESLVQRIEETLEYPVWIKPVHLGSSIGVTRVVNREGVAEAAELAFSLDDVLIADEEIEGREVEFSLLGNDYVRVAPPAEIVKPDVFHSYDKKYGAGASDIIVAKLTETQKKLGIELAKEMYKRAGCKGLARIDFFLDKEGHFWMNEINPMPGFTKTSAFPLAWKMGGLSMKEICDELIILAFHRSRNK